jgi:succinyl-diaminopimelate desuccinylase
VTGRRPELSTTGGTSDGRFLARICPQVVEFGPLNASIHQVDERVPIRDVERLARIYERTLQLVLGARPEADGATR